MSQHTVEEALLRKAEGQKRFLDDLVIQKGEFDWRTLLVDDGAQLTLTCALGEFEDVEDAQAARVAAREEMQLEDEDAQDFGGRTDGTGAGAGAGAAEIPTSIRPAENLEPSSGKPDEPADAAGVGVGDDAAEPVADEAAGEGEGDDEEEGRTIDDYMLDFVNFDPEFFADWNV